jgi:2-polyprenyl-3-methyl-5-hydroxy-6-metoxy-1,4-benzoquinol methylase
MMHPAADEKTTREHWDEAWAVPPRWRLPSPLFVSTRNLQRLLRRYVTPGMRVLEIGCAPGKTLAWVAGELHAQVAGLDYSERGVAWARQLFAALGLRGDLRCEPLDAASFAAGSFDVVYSAGVIEHFDRPGEVVRMHVNMAKPGGRAVMAIPHYGGIYGRLQRFFDRDNLALHNLEIMSPAALVRLAPQDLSGDVRAFAAGSMSPWLVNLDAKWPRPLARLAAHAVNAAALLQPVDVEALSPMLVLEISRRRGPAC